MPDTLTAPALLREAATYFDAEPNGLARSAPAAANRGFTSAGEWMRNALHVIRRVPNANSLAPQKGERAGGEGAAAFSNASHSSPSPRCNFSQLGVAKYGLASSAAGGMLALAVWQNSLGLALLMPLVFYAVEAQMVFLFPLAIDDLKLTAAGNFRNTPHPALSPSEGERVAEGRVRGRCITQGDVTVGHPLFITWLSLLGESRDWTKRAGGTLRVMAVVLPLAATMLLGGFFGRGFIRSWCLGCLALLIWYERLRTRSAAAPVSRAGLEIGATKPLLIRRETFRLLGQSHPIRVLYASDLHFRGNGSRRVAAQLLEAVRATAPDLILLGGDLVDIKRGLLLLAETVRRLAKVAPVWAIPGNHDSLAGVAEVQAAIEDGGGHWLGQRSLTFEKSGWARPLVVDAVAKNNPAVQPTILCAHDPGIFPEAVRRNYALVLAGHLHGGQCVLAERAGRLFPGAWFYRWNGLRFSENGTQMLVSRGVSDTLPLRWNCPREVLLCEIS